MGILNQSEYITIISSHTIHKTFDLVLYGSIHWLNSTTNDYLRKSIISQYNNNTITRDIVF